MSCASAMNDTAKETHRKDMKALFTAIRERDTEKITELITQKPELVNCIAKQPPKKDDGQSPLQIAFKSKKIGLLSTFWKMGLT